jgi:RNA polymerase sigma factor (sigma-70 family)
MTTTPTRAVLRHIRGLIAAGPAGQTSDGDLLERFATRREEAAFAALVRRHGPMVLGVCRRLLPDADADDAFQATFLALARQASAVGRNGSVGGWLYRVAYHAAMKARARGARRAECEQRAEPRPAADPLAELSGRELLAMLDEELQRLPERLRVPLVLCYLEGRTRDEAARELRWSLGTLKRRLERGRAVLRVRLARRGVALSVMLAAGAGMVAVPAARAAAAGSAAVLFASGNHAAVSARVLELMSGALRASTAGPRKLIGAVLLVATLIATGAGLFAYRAPAADEGPAPVAADTPRPVPETRPAEAAPADRQEMTITGRVVGTDGKPVPGAAVAVVALPLGPYRSGDREGYRGRLLAEGKSDAEGNFRLTAPRTSSARFRDVYAVATAEKCAPAWQRLSPDAERPQAVLKLPPEQVVRGSFVDLQGLPAAGVKVSVSYVGRMVNGQPDGVSSGNLPRHAPWPQPATTDEKGNFVIHGCNRDQGFVLAVSDDRFATQSFEIDAPGKARPELRINSIDAGGNLNTQVIGPNDKGQPEVLKLSLAPARVVEGRVVAADTGKPVAKASVSGTRTDEDGRFLLRFAGRDAMTLEVFAPEGSPYLSVHHRVQWPKGTVKQEVKIELPRGVLVCGKVTEAGSGKPVAGAGVQFHPGKGEDPARPKNALTGWSRQELTKDDGSFRMAVLPGAGHLLIQGPTPDYVHEEIGSEVIASGRAGGGRTYPDAFVKLDLPAKGDPKEVAVTLRRGVTVRGQLLGPDGKPVTKAVMLHRLHVGIDLSWHFAAEARDGVFEVHGLDPDKSVPVFFLDAENRCGAVVELSGKQAGEAVTVKLAPCGKATARYLDGKGQPVTNYRAAPDIVITPGPWDDYDATVAKGKLLADSGSLVNLDRHNYWEDRVKTDVRGRITFPALIPGATYRVSRWEKNNWLPHKEFTVESGKTLDLGDIIIDRAGSK